MTLTDYLDSNPLLRVAVALAVGVFAGDAMPWTVPLWVWLAAIALCLIVERLLKGKPYAQSFLIILALFLTGVALEAKAGHDTAYPFRGETMESYEAVITSEPQAKGKVLRCDLLLTTIDGKALGKPVAVKAAILRDTVGNDWRRLRLGSGIRARSVMQPLANYRTDSNFDYVRWLRCHGFRAQTFIFYTDWQQARVSLAPLSTTERLRLRAMKLRQKLVGMLSAGSGKAADSQTAAEDDQRTAVVAAMVLGDKHAIDSETKDDYSVSGASHVLALSGLHLGIIYGILTLLFGRGLRRRWLSQALVITAVWTYVALVGMGASVVRAAVMLTICSFCIVAGRDKASVNALSLAAIVMLVANPLCLWDVGTQMSFMAVLAIVLFYAPLYHLLPKDGKLFKARPLNTIIKMLWGTAAVSLAAQIGTAPLVAYYFGRFSCYFLLTNYIVVPCASLIIYGALAVFLSAPLPAVSAVLLQVLTAVSAFLNAAVSWIASLPGASIDNIRINAVQVACYYAAVAIVCAIAYYIRSLRPLHNLDSFQRKAKVDKIQI